MVLRRIPSVGRRARSVRTSCDRRHRPARFPHRGTWRLVKPGRVEAVLPARASCSFYAADPRGSFPALSYRPPVAVSALAIYLGVVDDEASGWEGHLAQEEDGSVSVAFFCPVCSIEV